jgi:tRNA threonylcarbamoyladenosine biosynthesis protein TsaE
VSELAFDAPDAEAMRALGGRFARALVANRSGEPMLVSLTGELGAGKTTFVAGALAALGHAGPVRSPTYTLVEPYEFAGRAVSHADLYRLRHPDELDDLGLRDLLQGDALLFVEWPERAEGRLRAPDVALEFRYAAPDARRVIARAQTTAGQAVLEHI